MLITSPDRLARNVVHQMVLLEEFACYGCQVDFLDQPMTRDLYDHLLLQIRGAVAEYECTLIAERMRRERHMKLRAGILLLWPSPPCGYRVLPDRPRDPAGVTIEPAEGAIVQELFRRYVQAHETLVGLSTHLLQLGIKSPRGKRCWSSATIRGLLSNPTYTGNVYVADNDCVRPVFDAQLLVPWANPLRAETPRWNRNDTLWSPRKGSARLRSIGKVSWRVW